MSRCIDKLTYWLLLWFNGIYTVFLKGKWSFDCIPIAIQISVENAEENSGIDGHCQVAYAAFEKVSWLNFNLKDSC